MINCLFIIIIIVKHVNKLITKSKLVFAPVTSNINQLNLIIEE